jgi:hypothetical protein
LAKKIRVPANETIRPTMEEVREKRRREVRSLKNVFQSREVEEEGGVVVEAWRTDIGVRQREGVKKDEGVLVAVGGLAARAENLERDIMMRFVVAAGDEKDRVFDAIDGVKKVLVVRAELDRGL